MEVINDRLLVSIDFGTFNIKCAVIKRDRPQIHKMNKSQNSDVLPNVVSIQKDSVTSGNKKSSSKRTSQTIVNNIKRHLEEEDWKIYVDSRDEDMSAMDIASEEFKWIKDNIESKLRRNITDTIITVPVCFSEMQKKRIIDSAENAGLPIKEVIVEPLGALFSYEKILDFEDDYNLLVYDFGGGTLDLSIFQLTKEDDVVTIEALASRGVHFGGQDITKLIYNNIFEKKYKRQILEEVQSRLKKDFLDNEKISATDKDPTSKVYKQNYENIKNRFYIDILDDINSFKEDICNQYDEGEDVPFSFDSCDIHSNGLKSIGIDTIFLNYQQLYNMVQKTGIFKTIENTIENLIDSAMIDYDDISKILIVGGTSNIPFFREHLGKCLGVDISTDGDDNGMVVSKENDEMYNAVAIGSVTYLKKKDIAFNIINRLSYEVGTIIDGKYTRHMDIDTSYNDITLRKAIKLSKDSIGSLRLNMYQVFHDTTVSGINIKEDAIYMGHFEFDSLKYSLGKSYLLELFFDESNSLYGNIYSSSGEKLDVLKLILT